MRAEFARRQTLNFMTRHRQAAPEASNSLSAIASIWSRHASRDRTAAGIADACLSSVAPGGIADGKFQKRACCPVACIAASSWDRH
jgi:hypothetical protein